MKKNTLTKKIAIFSMMILFVLFVNHQVKAQKISGFDYDKKEFAKTFTHKYATANGVKLHYVIGGKGEPVVLIHGYPLTWYEWRKIMPALAEKYTVIAPDMRGLGDSEVAKTGYDKRSVAEDIHQLLESLKVKKFLLVSHDMGGAAAYSLVNAYPQSISKWVIMESGIPGFGLEKAMDVADGGSWHFGFFMSDFAEMLTEGRERAFLVKQSYGKQNNYRKNSISDRDIDEYLRAYTKPGGMTAGFSYYRTLPEDAKYNKTNFTSKLELPVLVIDGEKSFNGFTLSNVKNIAENTRGVIIPNCGHFVPEEQPEKLTEMLLNFFAEK